MVVLLRFVQETTTWNRSWFRSPRWLWQSEVMETSVWFWQVMDCGMWCQTKLLVGWWRCVWSPRSLPLRRLPAVMWRQMVPTVLVRMPQFCWQSWLWPGTVLIMWAWWWLIWGRSKEKLRSPLPTTLTNECNKDEWMSAPFKHHNRHFHCTHTLSFRTKMETHSPEVCLLLNRCCFFFSSFQV